MDFQAPEVPQELPQQPPVELQPVAPPMMQMEQEEAPPTDNAFDACNIEAFQPETETMAEPMDTDPVPTQPIADNMENVENVEQNDAPQLTHEEPQQQQQANEVIPDHDPVPMHEPQNVQPFESSVMDDMQPMMQLQEAPQEEEPQAMMEAQEELQPMMQPQEAPQEVMNEVAVMPPTEAMDVVSSEAFGSAPISSEAFEPQQEQEATYEAPQITEAPLVSSEVFESAPISSEVAITEAPLANQMVQEMQQEVFPSDNIPQDELQNINAPQHYVNDAQNEIEMQQNQIEMQQNEAEMQQNRAQMQQDKIEMQQNEAGMQQNRAQMQQDEAQIHQNEAQMRQDEAQMQRNEAQMQRNEAQMRQNEAQMRQDEAQMQRNEAEMQQDAAQYTMQPEAAAQEVGQAGVQPEQNMMMMMMQDTGEQIMEQGMIEEHVKEEEDRAINTNTQQIKEQLPEPMDTDDAEIYTQQSNVTHMNDDNTNNMDFEPKQENLIPELVLCKNLLVEFMKRTETEPFNEPVDWKGLNLPDYPLIITKPMDLGTVATRLECNKYSTADQFASSVRLVFKNAKEYNCEGSGIYLVADSLLKQFERRYARITKNLSNKKRKSMDKMKNGEASTYKERETFTSLMQQLLPPELGAVVEIIDKKCPMALNDAPTSDGLDDELEIEVYHIDGKTLRDLLVHMEKTISKRSKKKKHAYY